MNHRNPETADSTDDTEQAGSEMLRKEPIDTSVAQSDQPEAQPDPPTDTEAPGRE